MAPLEVVISLNAYDDLDQIASYIIESSGFVRQAQAYIDRIFARCGTLGEMPEIGRLRPDLGDGLRQVPFESSTIVYTIRFDGLYILRIFHGGQDYETIMQRERW